MSQSDEDKTSWIVTEIEGRGRGVVSSTSIPSGASVLVERSPLVSVVHASRSAQACQTCMALRHAEVSTKFLPQPHKCEGCEQAVWCSPFCQSQSSSSNSHPPLICAAYQRLAQRASEAAKAKDQGNENAPAEMDEEMQSDARLLFYAYYYRRYLPQEFTKWNQLCSFEFAAAAPSTSASSSAAVATPASISEQQKDEEERIEALHALVVDCLQFAATSAESGTVQLSSTTPVPNAADLSLPGLSKQFTDLQMTLNASPDATSPLISEADLSVTRDVYLKTKCNGFALMAPNDKMGNRQLPRGYAIYTTAAMVNHSCLPNIARFDQIESRDVKYSKAGPAASSSSSSSSSSSAAAPPTDAAVAAPVDPSTFFPLSLEFRAMHAIQPYTELVTSYVPVFWERVDRKEQLVEEYGFKCRCERCRLEKKQERDEQANGEEGEHEHDHDHDGEEDEDEDEEGEDDEEGGEDDEEDNEPVSDDDEAEKALGEPVLSRGELNIFLMKYICPTATCGGAMAPVSAEKAKAAPKEKETKTAKGTSKTAGESMECNVCSKVRTDAQFHRQLQKEFGLRR